MMNIELFRLIHAGAGSQPILDFLSVAAAEVTPYLVIVCMAVFWFNSDNRGKLVLLEAAAAVVLGLIINQLIGLFYYHPRPFMMDLCKPLIPHAPETSFPSDHATLLFAVSLPLLVKDSWRRHGFFLFIIALCGAWGRVYTGLHFPFDIIGSFFVALLSMVILAAIYKPLKPLYGWIIRQVNQLEAFFTNKAGVYHA